MFVEQYDREICSCRPLSFGKKIACVRTSSVPLHSGTKSLIDQRARIRRDMVRMRRLLMIEGSRMMTQMLQAYFSKVLNGVADRVLYRLGEIGQRSAVVTATKSSFEFDLGGVNDAVWATAIQEVLGVQASIELVAEYTPIVQSVAARAYERTSIFIGEEKGPDASVNILRRSQDMARKVTRINETTRQNLAETIVRGQEAGMTTAEIAKSIKERVPEISNARIPTIVRTEVGTALDQGIIHSFKESKTVLTASVVGCKARERNSPTFMGVSTCNIQNVPVSQLDLLTWHPNHTGSLVAESFVGENPGPVS